MEQIYEDAYKYSGMSNVYLILKPAPMVIDTGIPNEREAIKKEIESIVSLDKIEIVLLTHLHYDHCGNVNLFENAKFYAPELEIDDIRNHPEWFFFGNMPEELRYILMNQLQKIPKYINGLEKIDTPGHTKGSVSLVDANRKLLFSGDTLFENGIGRTDFENSVPEQMRESLLTLHRLIAGKNLKLMPGHDY